jgi:hypothetical protein
MSRRVPTFARRARPHRLVAAVAVLVAAAVATAVDTAVVDAQPAVASAAPSSLSPAATWAPAAGAKIHPGTMMYTAGAQCTGNFVFTDAAGNTHLGYAAHSWITEHRLGTTDANTCAYNDLALVQIDAADVAKVNPSVPFWGGPTGLDTDGTATGDRVWTYGNSSLRAGASPLSPHTGVSLGDQAADGGWSHPLYTMSPGIPGDSGSGFMSQGGKAVGVLSTLGLAPLPLSNNIGDLARELAFAQQHSGIAGLQLVHGTEPFSPIL